MNKYTHIQVKLGISSTGCSPNVDFEKRLSQTLKDKVQAFIYNGNRQESYKRVGCDNPEKIQDGGHFALFAKPNMWLGLPKPKK